MCVSECVCACHVLCACRAQVPYLEDTGLQKRRHDIWTTSAELMHLAGGDFEEHAHLLAGYFLQLGLQVKAGAGCCVPHSNGALAALLCRLAAVLLACRYGSAEWLPTCSPRSASW